MNKVIKVIKNFTIVTVIYLSLNGCAAYVKNSWYNQAIKVTSEPSGANIIVNDKPIYVYKIVSGPLGSTQLEKTEQLKSTPNEFLLSINDSPFVLRIRKDGYYPEEIKITKSISGWSLLNLINFVGWDIDRSTGAINTLRPNKIHVILKKKKE